MHFKMARWCSVLIGGLFFLCASSWAQDACFTEQMACNERCGNDTQCQSKVCFQLAIDCQRNKSTNRFSPSQAAPVINSSDGDRLVAPQQGQQVEPITPVVSRGGQPRSKSSAEKKVKSYVLPPVSTCAKMGWKGESYLEFTTTNNCPAAVDAHVFFNDGTQVKVFCEGYDVCKAVFPKVRVSDRFQYRLKYATE